MATWFDESRLDDETALAQAVGIARDQDRPRAVVAAGPDSRLLRAAIEPWCPVPFVAWPNHALPGWAGSLDLVEGQFVAKMEATIVIGLPLVLLIRRFLPVQEGHTVAA